MSLQHLQPRLRSATDAGSTEPDWQRLALKRLGYLLGAAIGVCLIGAVLLLFRQPNVGDVRAGTERPAISGFSQGFPGCSVLWDDAWT